nr:prolyl oligopeptidase family serine peptidase [Candidatus Sigynarchaeota archaeon]
MSRWVAGRRKPRVAAIAMLTVLLAACMCAAIIDVAVQVPGIQAFYGANPSGITFREVRIPLRDGNGLAAYAVLPAGFDSIPASSAFLTVLSPGINGRKEQMLWKAYNFALRGFVAIAVEARGNGDSSGIASFGIDEPADLSDAITWALNEYPTIDPGKVSLCGQSLGAMFSVLAACKDSRVAATVAYHPPANFTSLLVEEFSIAQLIGSLPNFALDEASLQARSPITWINATLPRDILFLHGENDIEIPPENSLSLSQLANVSGHNDTYVIVRPGLDHPGNEGDAGSLALAIAWLNWSLARDEVPAPGVLRSQAAAITIEDVPSGSVDAAGGWLVAAAILLFLVLFTGLRSPLFPRPAASPPVNAGATPSPSRLRLARRAALAVLGILLAISFLLGLAVASGATSVVWGYLLFFPVIVLGFLVMSKYYFARQSGAIVKGNAWLHDEKTRNWIAGIIAVTGSVVFFSISYDACANEVMEPGMSVFNSAFLLYTSIFFMNFAVDIAFVDVLSTGSKGGAYLARLGKDTGLVFASRLASMGLSIVFLPAIYYTGIQVSINVLIWLGIPALTTAVYFLGGLLDRGTRSRTLVIIILVVILATFLEYRMFRFF